MSLLIKAKVTIWSMDDTVEKGSLLEAAEAKLKQLGEALSMLDRIGNDCDWAIDFSDYECISEALSQASEAIWSAHEDLEEEMERLNEKVCEYQDNRDMALIEVDNNCELKHYID